MLGSPPMRQRRAKRCERSRRRRWPTARLMEKWISAFGQCIGRCSGSGGNVRPGEFVGSNHQHGALYEERFRVYFHCGGRHGNAGPRLLKSWYKCLPGYGQSHNRGFNWHSQFLQRRARDHSLRYHRRHRRVPERLRSIARTAIVSRYFLPPYSSLPQISAHLAYS